MIASGSHASRYQEALGIISGIAPEMFDPVLPVGAEKIKPDTVPFLIDYSCQGVFKLCKLCRINETFEHRVLDR